MTGVNHALAAAATALLLLGVASEPQQTRNDSGEASTTKPQAVLKAEIVIPEGFFTGIPQPDNTVQFTNTCPASLDADRGWWNACAKLQLLTARGKADPKFLQAYLAARKDRALAMIEVTYAQWSRGSQEEKAAARKRIAAAVQSIVVKHGLRDLLVSTPVDEVQLGEAVARNQAKLAADLGGAAPLPSSLIEYCPGAQGNVSLNTLNPLFPKLIAALQKPEVDAAYRAAVAAFGTYLDEHPTSTADERNQKVLELMSPVLQKVD